VKGEVIKLSPVSDEHDLLAIYLRIVFDTYFSFNPIGRAKNASFVMRLEESYHEPDIQVILDTNPGEFTKTGMLGPADICIEVVSPESVARDYGKKFEEYEKAGVREYWIIDPLRQECRFHRLQESKLYALIAPDTDGFYRTPLLPKLALHVPTLWAAELPNPIEIVRAVEAMFV
jgi:Uma2 family endonuclease